MHENPPDTISRVTNTCLSYTDRTKLKITGIYLFIFLAYVAGNRKRDVENTHYYFLIYNEVQNVNIKIRIATQT